MTRERSPLKVFLSGDSVRKGDNGCGVSDHKEDKVFELKS